MMRPVTFGGCFGQLHQSSVGTLGVVLCASSEYEAAMVGQNWRVFADRLAEAGLPTLRFDYPGVGDSLGSTEDPEAFEASLASIREAVEVLRRETGVSQVALVGHRLGASLALMASETLALEGVVMIRPVVRGKGFIAEQRALGRILQSKEPVAVRRDADPGALTIEGFRISAESAAEIGRIDLAALTGRAPVRALIAGEKGSNQYDALRDSLVARGAFVTRLDLREVAGWAPAPVPTPPPLLDCEAIAGWLKESRAVAPSRPGSVNGLAGEGFRETAVAFGPAQSLSGILCQPSGAPAERDVVIFLNTGANSHVGAGRAAVHHARSLAARGVASLRMDIKGLGDSPWTAEGPLSAIHHAERVVDVSAAIDWLRGQKFEGVSLVGVCSGAFLSFQTALADPRVDRILLANPQIWLPQTAEQLADPRRGAYGSSMGYVDKLFRPATWKRLFSGDLAFGSIIGIARQLSTRAANRLRSKSRQLSARFAGAQLEGGALVDALKRLKARECEVWLALSEGDPARETLAGLLPGRDFAALEGLMRIVDAKGADHAFVMPRTRAEFFGILADFLSLGRARKSTSSASNQRLAA